MCETNVVFDADLKGRPPKAKVGIGLFGDLNPLPLVLCQQNGLHLVWFWRTSPFQGNQRPPTTVIVWSSQSYLLDWLHVVDLGVAAQRLGNMFYGLAFYQLPKSRRENTDFLVDKVMTFKGKNGSPPKHIKDYPEMRHPKPNIRYRVPLACQLCRHFGAKDALGKHQLAAMAGLMCCYDLLSLTYGAWCPDKDRGRRLESVWFAVFVELWRLREALWRFQRRPVQCIGKISLFFPPCWTGCWCQPACCGWKGLFFSPQLHHNHCQSQGWIFYDGQIQGGHAPEMVLLLKVLSQQKMSWWKKYGSGIAAFSFVVHVHGIFQPALASFSPGLN